MDGKEDATAKERLLRMRESWAKVGPLVERLERGPARNEFYLHLRGEHRVAMRYAASMNARGRAQYGRELQAQALRLIDLDLVSGAVGCIVGMFMESTTLPPHACSAVPERVDALIRNAAVWRGDETGTNSIAS